MATRMQAYCLPYGQSHWSNSRYATKMLEKPTEKSRKHYRRQVDEAITGQLSKIDLLSGAIEIEREAFWKSVDLEMTWQSYGWHHEPDGAA